jgi:hypothetical protein
MVKSEPPGWLTRLGTSQPFFSVADQRPSRESWSLGGLAAGAIPEAVRSTHGYQAQLPSDAQATSREARPGDFFRN